MNTNDNVTFDLTSNDNNVSLHVEESAISANMDIEHGGCIDKPNAASMSEVKRDTIEERLVALQAMLNSMKLTVASAIQEVKQIDKAYTKEKKRKTEKEKDIACVNSLPKDGSRKGKVPSGFARPVAITDELCIFMSIKEGSKVARTEVTRFLNKYIADNKLQDKQAKTKINADEPLKNLLRLGEQELTYFNLQKYMNQHFV